MTANEAGYIMLANDKGTDKDIEIDLLDYLADDELCPALGWYQINDDYKVKIVYDPNIMQQESYYIDTLNFSGDFFVNSATRYYAIYAVVYKGDTPLWCCWQQENGQQFSLRTEYYYDRTDYYYAESDFFEKPFLYSENEMTDVALNSSSDISIKIADYFEVILYIPIIWTYLYTYYKLIITTTSEKTEDGRIIVKSYTYTKTASTQTSSTTSSINLVLHNNSTRCYYQMSNLEYDEAVKEFNVSIGAV